MARLVLGACLAALLSACTTPTESRSGVQTAKITDVRGYVEGVARVRESEIRSKVSTGHTKYEESIFEEDLSLTVDGYAYHPNFLEFSLGGLFGLLQNSYSQTFDGRERTSDDDGTVNEFDLTGDFFKKKKYPGTVFARRYQRLQPRPFQSSLKTTTDDYGLIWQYVSDKTPTTLQLNHTDVRLDPLDKNEAEGRQKNTSARFQTAYRFTDHNVLSLQYERKSVEEQPFNFNYDSDEVTLSHLLNFGESHRHSLESEVNYFNQEGTFNIERLRWREVLRLRHTEKLRSVYQAEVARREQGSLTSVTPLTEDSLYGSAMLEHELYESLVTQILGWAQRQDFENGPQIDRLGGQLSLDYRKKNALGVLRANYRPRIQTEDRQGQDRDIEIIDERHGLSDPNPATLGAIGIRSSSIRITDLNRTQLYQLGRDYTVESFPDRVEIRRVPTGFIADGETVLVSYTYHLSSSVKIDTFNQNFDIRQEFSFGLTPYYRLLWQDQSLSPPDARGAIEEDITAHIFGVEYRWKPIRLQAEFEDHDSTITPFKATRLSGDLTHRFKSGATAGLRTRWTDVTRGLPQDRETEFFTIEGRCRYPITQYLATEGTLLYRNQKDTISGDEEGVDLDLALEYVIRQTELRITYELGQFESDFAESEYSALYVQLRRRF